MNANEMQNLLKSTIKSLPKDMQTSEVMSDKMISKLSNNFEEINDPLQKSISNMVDKINDKGRLSAEDQSEFACQLTKIFLPYMKKMTDEIIDAKK